MQKRAGRPEKLAAAGSVISFALAAVFIRLSGLDVPSLVNLQNIFIKKALLDSAGLNTAGSLSLLASYFASALAGLVFLTLAFAFLASYGYYNDRKKIGLVISAIGAAVFFAVLGVTLASLIVAAGVFFSGYIIVPLSNNYGNELRKWIHFRVGSNSASRAHFLFNLFVAAAVFFSVLSGLPAYQAGFREDLKQSISAVVMPGLPQGADEKAVGIIIGEQVDRLLTSPVFSGYFRWLPVVSAFAAWALLEILRLFLPYAAGAFTHILIRLQGG